jgi:hypothetical protein
MIFARHKFQGGGCGCHADLNPFVGRFAKPLRHIDVRCAAATSAQVRVATKVAGFAAPVCLHVVMLNQAAGCLVSQTDPCTHSRHAAPHRSLCDARAVDFGGLAVAASACMPHLRAAAARPSIY